MIILHDENSEIGEELLCDLVDRFERNDGVQRPVDENCRNGNAFRLRQSGEQDRFPQLCLMSRAKTVAISPP